MHMRKSLLSFLSLALLWGSSIGFAIPQNNQLHRAGAVKSLEYGLLTVAAPLLLLVGPSAAASEHLLYARWHGEFEPGTPKTVQIGRFFLKYLATSHLYPSKFENFQKNV